MPRPQTITQLVDAVLARAPVADSRAAFIVGFFEKGPTDSLVPCLSMAEVNAAFGARTAYSSAIDAIETIFRLSGGVVYPLRELGPTPVFASANVFDQAGSTNPGDIALVLHAAQYGDFFNAYDFEITVPSAGNFEITIYDGDAADDDSNVLETSGALADRAAAVAWALESTYLSSISLGASNEDPRAQTGSFSGGTDDHSNATITEFAAALARATTPKGGFVAAPGQTTDAIHTALTEHGLEFFRLAVPDSPDTAVEADLISDVATITAEESANVGALFAPWPRVSGAAAGSTVTVPPSALVIGLHRRNDAAGQSLGQPAAGPLYGVAPDWVTGVSQTWTNDEQDALADGLVNVIRLENGQVVVNGARTCADPDSRPQWSGLGGTRATLQIAAEGDAIVDRYRHSPLNRDTFMKVERDLLGLCAKYASPPHEVFYERDNGDGTFDPGYSVDAISVNTPETIAARELNAQLTLTTNEHAEQISFLISKSAIG